MGPDAISAALSGYSITLVIPSSGTYVVKSESFSEQLTTGGLGTASSYTFKNGIIPPVLNSGGGIIAEIGGQAQFFLDLPVSTPTRFSSGDTINIVEQPQKLRCGLWQAYVWILVCPYTMGATANPANISYTPNPLTCAHGTAIAPMTPTYTGGAPLSYSVSPSLPAGLSLDTLTGEISGTPTSTTATATYTVTAANAAGSGTCSLGVTIT
jgi:hypothetical protein